RVAQLIGAAQSAGTGAAVTRVATRVAMRGGSGPFITTGTLSQTATLHLANSINTPVIDHWRGRVAVLLGPGATLFCKRREDRTHISRGAIELDSLIETVLT
ncbi:MAG TPA: hypothetical protein VF348_11640, partial [Usitatibacter sp.]